MAARERCLDGLGPDWFRSILYIALAFARALARGDFLPILLNHRRCHVGWIAYPSLRVGDKRRWGMIMQEEFRDNQRNMHPRQRMQNICTETVRYEVNATLGEDDRQKPIKRSLYGYLLHEMAEAAMKYAVAEKIDPDDFEDEPAHLESLEACDQRYSRTGMIKR
jgi:hypothetical protein